MAFLWDLIDDRGHCVQREEMTTCVPPQIDERRELSDERQGVRFQQQALCTNQLIKGTWLLDVCEPDSIIAFPLLSG